MYEQHKSNYVLAALGVIALVALLVWYTQSAPSSKEKDGIANEVPTQAEPPRKVNAGAGGGVPAPTRLYTIDVVRIIYYDENGFDPFVTEVRRGYDVRFVNDSDLALRVAKLDLPGKDGYEGLSQSSSVGKGSQYSVNFTRLGVWGFYNLNNPAHRGAIVVVP
ncbi:MAG: hypothetical protein COV10_03265 [Candidatus Vogelbacteria bacterium CG10_big_fil_rev_8_21_14_0_10_51_16]|uniref:EfeO-type cupredoxin-like domain-containing protein n=1 Tax=Candidatus Vogelbacteria bacterium CG10_big_fil_rev_8_21_14_0_10_51_16 TaxID=1975045 RepID=A0A2H0RDZ0_9BACT|nr:MAG: hypothetical protein COV10_03265 [Candidatus Vogelbacteria bacterium CG10_big_fil_rev_8_21_14_0_10_51_16]